MKDLRHVPRVTPINSSVVRALNTFSTTERPRFRQAGSGTTPCHSEPSSPMKKEPSPFIFPGDSSSAFHQPIFFKKMDRMISERTQVSNCLSINSPIIADITLLWIFIFFSQNKIHFPQFIAIPFCKWNVINSRAPLKNCYWSYFTSSVMPLEKTSEICEKCTLQSPQ